MRHASVFTGIGAADLAAQWMGWNNVFQVEIDDFCNKVLAKNFPGVKRYGDIKEFNGSEYKGAIDVLTGGFPCQKYSVAGNQLGNEPLKKEMLRVFSEIKPRVCIIENVAAFASQKFAHEHNELCEYMEGESYEVQTFDIDAASCGLPTVERHLWIIASSNLLRCKRSLGKTLSNQPSLSWELSGSYQGKGERWAIPEARVCRVGEGISDRIYRTNALGNAFPPKVMFEIFKAIEEIIL